MARSCATSGGVAERRPLSPEPARVERRRVVMVEAAAAAPAGGRAGWMAARVERAKEWPMTDATLRASSSSGRSVSTRAITIACTESGKSRTSTGPAPMGHVREVSWTCPGQVHDEHRPRAQPAPARAAPVPQGGRHVGGRPLAGPEHGAAKRGGGVRGGGGGVREPSRGAPLPSSRLLLLLLLLLLLPRRGGEASVERHALFPRDSRAARCYGGARLGVGRIELHEQLARVQQREEQLLGEVRVAARARVHRRQQRRRQVVDAEPAAQQLPLLRFAQLGDRHRPPHRRLRGQAAPRRRRCVRGTGGLGSRRRRAEQGGGGVSDVWVRCRRVVRDGDEQRVRAGGEECA